MFDWQKPPIEVYIFGAATTRLACAVFKVLGKGILFAEVGYQESAAHPFHLVEGQLVWDEANEQWECGNAILRLPSEEGRNEYEEWARDNPEYTDPDLIKEIAVRHGLVDSTEELS